MTKRYFIASSHTIFKYGIKVSIHQWQKIKIKYNTEDIKKNKILFNLSKKKILLLLTRDNPERHCQCGKSQDKIKQNASYINFMWDLIKLSSEVSKGYQKQGSAIKRMKIC